MLNKIIHYSVRNKFFVLLMVLAIIAYGSYALTQIPIGAVPDVTNNQVQIITTSRNLSTEDVEKFITYPVELEMANLPGVKEIRSVSKFGLSVVTIVFEEDMDTYLPRQLIAEKLKTAQKSIPQGFGSPFMGPITTGLGEIYQYTLQVDSAHRELYDLTDIRTIQDWIIRRQLSGIKGVVEINTWGGYLKQYEVALNPEKLRAMDIKIGTLFQALQNNNSVAGGAYIEKVNQSYFIRAQGLAGSLDDLRNIVIDNRRGVPIYMKDVGVVEMGHANRFGAITANGEGETIMGQIMMLKGANPKATIDLVKERIAAVQKNLPPGIHINPTVDRSDLIGRTTFTIAENLVLGILIVIFVVVLLLGNWRSGMVVASVIPISLLFALSMMHLFGVDANLLSLGAIDFGIIIDGAVIIVEYIAYRITRQRSEYLALSQKDKPQYLDEVAAGAAQKMMNSAVFGQLIILIVFIPILSLSGVEGKMFTPMALVFSFALIGTMIMGFTYVPVASALLIRPTNPSSKNISQRLIRFLDRRYLPTMKWALRHQKAVVIIAIGLLVSAGFLFSRMGGEFVPTLDEGDFVIQPILKTGTSLSNTVETTTQMEQLLLEHFPEVKQAVSRIGAAEVPTDPMSMEEIDLFVTLEPPAQWTTADNKEALADSIKALMSTHFPAVELQFTQPIEMRFNELITGVRADLAIKVFGENLDVLYQKGLKIQEAIKNVPGAADIAVDKTGGLPQMSIKYDRAKIARYGLNIQQVNDIVQTSFGGKTAGTVFEGEKMFDIALRFDTAHRRSLNDIKATSIQLPQGGSVRLQELADITYSEGPAMISRDETKRRIVVGVNVRGRDLESVVMDVQRIVEEKITLPTGYSVTYGGQFENLRSARQRLSIAVPVALALIFILLYLAFNSVSKALLIYTAIPLSAVGGVFLLYLRDMPFSISAGVGFIALFGIAVLNGIVLIEEFNELQEHGVRNIYKRVLLGTTRRLRPVLLTASAAALGFLPMAVSTSAGAEVQRPLATVVVGGLISATALTLVVLPILYVLLAQRRKRGKNRPFGKKAGMWLLLLSLPATGIAQSDSTALTLGKALEIALQNNQGYQATQLRKQKAQVEIKTAWDIGKTSLYYNYDENNIAPNNQALDVWGISHNLNFPTVYGARKRVLKETAQLATNRNEMQRYMLKKSVSQAYFTLAYRQQLVKQWRYLDSLYGKLARAAQRRFEVGEAPYLDMVQARNQKERAALQRKQAQSDKHIAQTELQRYLQIDFKPTIAPGTSRVMPLNKAAKDSLVTPQLKLLETQEKRAERQVALEKNKLLPDLQINGFRGTNNLSGSQAYYGVQLGVGIPLAFGAQKARMKAASLNQKAWSREKSYLSNQLERRLQALQEQRSKYREGLRFYTQSGQKLARETRKFAAKAYQEGEIDVSRYLIILQQATQIEREYYNNLWQYNLKTLEIQYLTL